MRQLVLIPVVAILLAGCAFAGITPALSPAPSHALPTPAPPTPTFTPVATSTSDPSPAPSMKPRPTATAMPTTGWPSVSRAGVTLTGAADESGGKMDGRLRLSITMTGLRPGQAVSLAATATYAASWVCGVAPPPCGELGCGPAAWEQTNGTAETIVTAVAGKAGTTTLGISLRVAPPARTCPSNTASPWGTQWEEWKGVRVTDAVRGLRLTPGTIAYGWTA